MSAYTDPFETALVALRQKAGRLKLDTVPLDVFIQKSIPTFLRGKISQILLHMKSIKGNQQSVIQRLLKSQEQLSIALIINV